MGSAPQGLSIMVDPTFIFLDHYSIARGLIRFREIVSDRKKDLHGTATWKDIFLPKLRCSFFSPVLFFKN